MTPDTLTIPEFCLVLLIGPSGAGKTTFAHRHFKQTEVISSDKCRGMVCDDEGNQAATQNAFDLLHVIVEKHLKNRRLTIADATNLLTQDRAGLLQLTKKYHAQTLAVVFNLDSDIRAMPKWFTAMYQPQQHNGSMKLSASIQPAFLAVGLLL